MVEVSSTLRRKDLPSLHADASAVSARNQRWFYRLTRATLLLGVLAAVGGVATIEINLSHLQVDMAAVGSMIAFAGMSVLTIYIQAKHPERVWYQARALAESVKTLAWQYSVGGSEYVRGASDEPDEPDEPDAHEVRARFLAELQEIVVSMNRLGMEASLPLQEDQITDAMRTLRSKSLFDRYESYLEGRIQDQRDWYEDRSAMNSMRAKRLTVYCVLVQIAGVVAGVFLALEVLAVDVLGIAAASAAAFTAWQQAKDHEALAEAYAVTAEDLELVGKKAEEMMSSSMFTEQSWAEFIDSAEQAISREHTVWRARRGVASHR
jgi:hypothetical protein